MVTPISNFSEGSPGCNFLKYREFDGHIEWLKPLRLEAQYRCKIFFLRRRQAFFYFSPSS